MAKNRGSHCKTETRKKIFKFHVVHQTISWSHFLYFGHGLYSFVYLADTEAWKLWVTKACYFNIVVKPQESIKDGMGESSLQVIF